ncbi:MAG: amidohydrolase family protein [Bryobacterales bacterium]|nr:amidohydrolase family protein [Bryobacterales bacterium]
MEKAIRKMTSANAATIHIYDRGLLRPGMMADVTVFDPNRLIDNATFEKPRAYASGIEYVVVNGGVVLDPRVPRAAVRSTAAVCGSGSAVVGAVTRFQGVALPPA